MLVVTRKKIPHNCHHSVMHYTGLQTVLSKTKMLYRITNFGILYNDNHLLIAIKRTKFKYLGIRS